MRVYGRFAILLLVKYLTKLFYRHRITWFSDKRSIDWSNCRLLIFLNHTSLYEPVFFGAAPNGLLKQIAANLIVPIADNTHQRPIVGRLLSLLVPGFVPISRKRDDTWRQFLDQIQPHHMTCIAPEGRMKRRNGLDKDGKPMDVKPGVVDILERLEGGTILIAYSGGLHHIQAPGESIPRIFKSVNVGIEVLDLDDYKSQMAGESKIIFKNNVVSDLNQRLKHCDELDEAA